MDAVLIAVIISSVVIIAVLVILIVLLRSSIAGMGERVSETQRASGAVINQQLNEAMAQIREISTEEVISITERSHPVSVISPDPRGSPATVYYTIFLGSSSFSASARERYPSFSAAWARVIPSR